MRRRSSKSRHSEYLFLEAPRTKEFITGSEAARRLFVGPNNRPAIAYPIATLQSETMQLSVSCMAKGYVKNTTVVRKKSASWQQLQVARERRSLLYRDCGSWNKRLGGNCFLARASAPSCGDVHLSSRECTIGHSA